MQQERPIDRPAARLIVLNEKDEVLLLRLEGNGGPLWITPGGGLQAGETYEQAARRELKEETGIEVEQLGPWVWKGAHLWHGRHQTYRRIGRFYLVRLLETPEVDICSLTGSEAKVTTEYRWWSIDEIRQSRERFSPHRMADLLAPLIAGEIPTQPIDAGPFSYATERLR
ncbi:MAG: NUDIX domain-containing protein [Chloroflexi bacterium]|nr:NUDIX domain-containing protein [Chloroflexota bacterium]